MTSPTQHLQELGFSQYEAQAYVALLQRNPLNGYELAKISGVPRANIYHVLDRLAERGAVARLDAEDGTRFVPILPNELIGGMRLRLQANLDEAQHSLCHLQSEDRPFQVWNLEGYSALIDQAAGLAGSAQEELLVAIAPPEAVAMAESLENARERGVEITTLCLAGCPGECGSCQGAIHRYHIIPENETRTFLLVKDHSEVLAGEVGRGASAQGIRTRQHMLVDLAARTIRDRIAVGAIVLDLGGQLEDLLQPETRQVLAAVGSGGDQRNWLEHMRMLLTGPRGPAVEHRPN